MTKQIWPLTLLIAQFVSVHGFEYRASHVPSLKRARLVDGRIQDRHCDVPFNIEFQVVIRRDPPAMRFVFISLEPRLFLRENLRKAFLCLSERYSQPEHLVINARSDGEQLRRDIEHFLAEEAIRPDGSLVGPKNITTDPPDLTKKLGGCLANYYRSVSIEQFLFAPDQNQTNVKTELIRHPYFPTGDNNSDLVRAANDGVKPEVIRLLDNGADPSGRNKFGTPPLIAAILSGHREIAKILLDHGADINQRDVGGWTPLMCAARYGNLGRQEEIAMELLSRNADVDAKAQNGDTALTIATESDAASIVDRLLSKGADPNTRDKYGRTPLMVAERYGYRQISALIKQALTRR